LQAFIENDIGRFKDFSVRFNSLMRKDGIWGYSYIPDNGILVGNGETLDFFTVTVNGIDYVIPKLAICAGSPWKSEVDIMYLNSLESDFEILSTANNSHQESVANLNKLDELDILKRHYKLVHYFLNAANLNITSQPPLFTRYPSTQNRKLKYLTNNNHSVTEIIEPVIINGASKLHHIASTPQKELSYLVYDNRTAIFKLSTLMIKSHVHFKEVLDNAYRDAMSKGIQHLIVDVTSNGGGYVCLSYLLTSLLVREWENGNWELYDFRVSPTTDRMVQYDEPEIRPSTRINPTTKRSYTDFSYYSQKVPIVRGGKESYYTQKTYYPDCDYYYDFYGTPPYYFDKILFITDGLCASSCALLVTKMSYHGKAAVLTHGGIFEYEMDISTTPGGNVYDWSYFTNRLHHVELPSLPTTAATRFTFNELYIGQEMTPREFERYPANFHTYMWDAVYNSDIESKYGIMNLEKLYATADQMWYKITSGKLPTYSNCNISNCTKQ